MNVDFWELILDLLILVGAAVVLGTVCERLKQSAVVGYMLAGLLVGPNGFHVIHNNEMVSTIAQLGVALLMFTIGLEFSWSKLRRMGLVALGSGTLQILITGAAGAGVALALGSGLKAAIAVGAVVSLSSTAVVAPVLARRAQLDSVHGRFSLGVLLVQDAAVVPLILLIAALGGTGTGWDVLWGVGQSLLFVTGFIVASLVFSRWMLPLLLRGVPTHSYRDAPVLLAFAAAVGASWAANALGLSPALGAFILAIFLGESVIATQVRADVGPLKILFVTMFFGSIGMYADPVFVIQTLPLVGFVLVSLVLIKTIVVMPIGLLFGLPLRHAVAAGMCLAQIGVFSFVLIQVAQGTPDPADDVISPQGQKLLVSVIILSIFLTPYLVGAALPVGGWIELALRRAGLLTAQPVGAADPVRGDQGHVVLVGFGPAGQAVAQVLRDDKTPITLVELNMRTVLQARAQGMRAYGGDATSPETLEPLNLPGAAALVVTLPDHRLAEQVIRLARSIAPGLRIVARARYSAYVQDLTDAGAQVVVDEEATLGQRVGQALHDALHPSDTGEHADEQDAMS